MNTAELIQREIKLLPEKEAKEVLDFIAFLKVRSERAEWEDMMKAQIHALSDIWNNDEDEVWNHV